MKHQKMKLTPLCYCLAIAGIGASVFAAENDNETAEEKKAERITITGTNIKRTDAETALPVTVLTREDIIAAGVSTPEQLLLNLNIAGNSNDNLASNEGIVGGNSRGNNGFSGANLRGQGSEATLVLLNGRRVAVHGMKGQAVDLNTIPLAAIERVEILRDGASSIYGTDAIGGVINFITKKDFRGAEVSAFVDTTQQGGGDIKKYNVLIGGGDFAADGWNAFISIGFQDNERLRGVDRDFTSTFQPERGLAPDTRGAEYATIMARGGSLITGNLTDPLNPSLGTVGSINLLNLPGGAGCDAYDNQGAYGWQVWDFNSARYACAWDYPRAQSLQQPVQNTNVVSRASFNFGNGHEAFVEFVGSHIEIEKSFEAAQITQTSLGPTAWYPSSGAMYDTIYNGLLDYFGAQANLVYGNAIAYRWRCMDCGNREIATETDAQRLQAGIEGSWGDWDYRAGLSSAYSESESYLSGGYYYRDGLASALGSGLVNMWMAPGQHQSDVAMQAINAASASGVTLYGGRSTVKQADFQISGDTGINLPGGNMMLAAGIDMRREGYEFNGDRRAADARPDIYLAPFDDSNALDNVTRDVNALYTEVFLPLLDEFEMSLSLRHDKYDGFGSTTNPKVSFKYKPVEDVAIRGSYSTGFRVPTFSQLYFGVTDEAYTGLDLADPATCPDGVADDQVPGCELIQPNIRSGGKETLQPEESKQYTFGVLWQINDHVDAAVDYWNIEKTDSIQSTDLDTMIEFYTEFAGNFIRDQNGEVTTIDTRWVNAGGSKTSGVEFTLNVKGEVGDGVMSIGFNGSYLDNYQFRALDSLPFSDNLVGQHARDANIPLRWKHSMAINYVEGNWSHTLTQVYRDGYLDEEPVSVEAGTYIPEQWNPNVKSYTLWHYMVNYSGFENMILTGGIKNVLDQDPPFTAHQNDFSAGAAWEPRVADPRGRSFVAAVQYQF